MKKNNDKNKTYLKKSIVGLTLVSAVSLLPLTFDKTSSKEQAESSSVDLKSNFQTNTPLANEQVSKVQTYQKFGHDQGVSSSILAVTDPWETIVDITRYEKDNKKHLIALTAYSLFSKPKSEVQATKNQKLRFFEFSEKYNTYVFKKEVTISDSIEDENNNNTYSQIFNNNNNKTIFNDWYKNFSVSKVTNLEYLAQDDKLVLYGTNGYAGVFASSELNNNATIALPVTTVQANDQVQRQSTSTSPSTSQSTNASSNPGVKNKGISWFLSENDGTFKNTYDSFQQSYSNYKDQSFETKAFLRASNGKYFWAGEAEYLTITTNEGVPENKKFGIFQGEDFFGFKNTVANEEKNIYWHSKYTKDYEKKWSSSVNLLLEHNSTIYAFGGIEHQGYVAKINSSTGNVDIKKELQFQNSSLGEIISGFVLDGKFFLASKTQIIEMDADLNVKKTYNINTHPDASKIMLSPNGIRISKIISNGQGGFSVLTTTNDTFEKKLLANSYSDTHLSVLRFGIHNLDKQYNKNTYHYKNSPPSSDTNPSDSELTKKVRGSNLTSMGSSLLSFDYNSEKGFVPSGVNNNFGFYLNGHGNQRPNYFTHSPNGISDIFDDGKGGYYSVHLDGTIKKLNAKFEENSWVSSSNPYENENLWHISKNFETIKNDVLQSVKNPTKTYFTSDHKGVFVIAKDNVYYKRLVGNNQTLLQSNLADTKDIIEISPKVFLVYSTKNVRMLVLDDSFNKTTIDHYSLTSSSNTSSNPFNNQDIQKILHYNTRTKIPSTTNDSSSTSTTNNDNVVSSFVIYYRDNDKSVSIENWEFDFSTKKWAQKNVTSDANGTKQTYTLSNKENVKTTDVFIDPSTKSLMLLLGRGTDNSQFNQPQFKVYNTILNKYNISKNYNFSAAEEFTQKQNYYLGSGKIQTTQSAWSDYQLVTNKQTSTIQTVINAQNINASYLAAKGAKNALVQTNDKKVYLIITGNPKYLSASGFENTKYNAFGVATISDVQKKLDLSETKYSHFIDSDFAIESIVNDGFGGYYLYGKTTLIRLNSQFEVINYHDFSKTMSKITSVALDLKSNIVVNGTKKDNTTQGTVEYLNPLFSKGFVEYSQSSNLYTQFKDSETKEEYTKRQDAWKSEDKVYYDQKANQNKTIASQYKLDQKVFKIPKNSKDALKEITFLGTTINLTINEDKVWRADFADDKEIDKIKKYYKDLEIQYSFEGYTNSNGEQIWVRNAQNEEAHAVFKNLLSSENNSYKGYSLSVDQINAFDKKKILVRFAKKFSNSDLFPDTNQEKVLLSETKNHQSLKQIVRIFNNGSFFTNTSNYWNSISSLDTQNSFVLQASDNTKQISSSNIKIDLPQSIKDLSLYKNGILDVKFSTSSDFSNAQDKDNISKLSNIADESTQLYWRFEIKDAHKSDYVFLGENNQENNYSFSKLIQSFSIPSALEGAEIKNYDLTSFSGNSKELSATETIGDAVKEQAKSLLVVEYAIGKENFDTQFNSNSNIRTSEYLLSNISGKEWFTLDELKNALKNQQIRNFNSTDVQNIYARLRLKNQSDHGKYYFDTSIKKVYSHANGSTKDSSKFKVWVNVANEFNELGNSTSSNSNNLLFVKGNDTSSVVFDTSKTRFLINYDTLKSRKVYLEYNTVNDSSNTTTTTTTDSWKRIDSFASAIDISSTGKIFVRIKAEEGYEIDQDKGIVKELGVAQETKIVITDINSSSLKEQSKLVLSGNLFNLSIEEKDEIFNSKHFSQSNTVANFKANVEVGYRIDSSGGYVNRAAFISYLQSLSPSDISKLRKENLEVLFILTRAGSQRYVIQTNNNDAQKPHVDNVKNYANVSKHIENTNILEYVILSGSSDELNINPSGIYSQDSLTEAGIKMLYGHWSISGQELSYTFSENAPTKLITINNSDYDSYTSFKFNGKSKTKEEIKALNLDPLSIKFAATDELTTIVGLGNKESGTSDVQEEKGYRLDHTRIRQVINVSQIKLKDYLNFSGSTKILTLVSAKKTLKKMPLKMKLVKI